jgi:large subunit ribosomal protein L9
MERPGFDNPHKRWYRAECNVAPDRCLTSFTRKDSPMHGKKKVELLLHENVSNLGIVGDVVHVKPGYARNYLLPMGLATPPTQAQIDRLAERRKEMQEQLERERAEQQAMIDKLEGFEITLQRSANEQGVLFGSVTQHEIGEQLREEGFNVEDRFVRIGEQIKRLDSYQIPIEINKEMKTEIKLWVVSDRPLEEQEEGEQEPSEGEEAEEQAEA